MGFWLRGAAMFGVCLSLSACLGDHRVPSPTVAPATASPTPELGFSVNVTGVPTKAPTRPKAPTPTPFRVPAGAWLRLIPNYGPPDSRLVAVRGGHLPPSVEIDLVWSAGKKRTSISVARYSDRHGNMTASFRIPAAPPGPYAVLAVSSGLTYASSTYLVASSASLKVDVSPGSPGSRIEVRGKHFLHGLQLQLLAYSLTVKRKPVILGSAVTDAHGKFIFTLTTSKLLPGQYVLRAWSMNGLSAQMAESFFEVVV